MVEKLKVESEEKKKTRLSFSNPPPLRSIMTTVAQDDSVKHRVSPDSYPDETTLLVVDLIRRLADVRRKNEQERIRGFM